LIFHKDFDSLREMSEAIEAYNPEVRMLYRLIKRTKDGVTAGSISPDLPGRIRDSLLNLYDEGISRLVFIVNPKVSPVFGKGSQSLERVEFFPRQKNNGSFRVSVETPQRLKSGTAGRKGEKKGSPEATTIVVDEISDDEDINIELTPQGKGSGRSTYDIPIEAIEGVEIEVKNIPLFAPILEQIGQREPNYRVMAEGLTAVSKYLAEDRVQEIENIFRAWKDQEGSNRFQNKNVARFNNDLKQIARLKDDEEYTFTIPGKGKDIGLKFLIGTDDLPTVELIEPVSEKTRDLFDEIKPGNCI